MAVRLRIQAVLADRGRLSNAEIRRISGYSRTKVLRLMRLLSRQGLVLLHGRGRGAYYAPGPNLAARKKVTPRGRK